MRACTRIGSLPFGVVLFLHGITIAVCLHLGHSSSLGAEEPAPGDTATIAILGAAERLKLRDPQQARAILDPLCPGGLDKAVKGMKRNKAPCSLIVIAETESRGTSTPAKISLLYWKVADDVRQAGELNVARALYQVAIDRDPKEFENWYWLGIVQRDLSAFADSTQSLRQALEIRPGDRDATYWVATNFMDLGNYEAAAGLLDLQLKMDPKDGRAWFRRGQVLSHQGKCPDAIEEFKKAESLGIDPKRVKQEVKACTGPP